MSDLGGKRNGSLRGTSPDKRPLHGDGKPSLRGCRTVLQSGSVFPSLETAYSDVSSVRRNMPDKHLFCDGLPPVGFRP